MAMILPLKAESVVTVTELIQPLDPRDAPSLEDLLSKIPENIEDNYHDGFDPVSFDQRLIQEDIAPKLDNVTDEGPVKSTASDGNITEGTWGGTQLALKEFYSRVEISYAAFFAAAGVETPIPQQVAERAKLFPWSDPVKDDYPPHFYIPTGSGGSEPTGYSAGLTQIFDTLGLLQAGIMLNQIIPDKIFGSYAKVLDEKIKAFFLGDKSKGLTMADLEGNNQDWLRRKTATDVMQGKNIGDLEDWWSDARFGQQQFTGTNPVTITVASDRWLKEFQDAATAQDGSPAGKAALEFLQRTDPKTLFVQDFSYFREAVDVDADAPMTNDGRYTVAAVSLFHLNEKGVLHPISICIDYKGSIDKSVVVFNRRLEATSEWDTLRKTKLADEKQDWPWRYAKQCAQTSDWVRHEIASHLTHTHLVEEAILVAANRTLPIDHVVFKLLEPHWFRTLPLNAAARQTLVPEIIFGLLGLKDKKPYKLINYFYENFDFQKGYIPEDLRIRGFPAAELDHEKHRNYVYAKNMNLIWNTIRKFVKSMLSVKYTENKDVTDDDDIKRWCKETRERGLIPTFPEIDTVDKLIDACTTCIHIASPQHTAVNYLQNFYHVFIPSKPPALWSEPPSTLDALMKYTEQDVLKSLPVNHQREWLLATQIPWLLSFKTADEHSLLKYSQQLYNLVRKSEMATDKKTKESAAAFYKDLRGLVIAFNDNSVAMTRGTVPYVVMDPASTAVSILI